MKITVLVTDFLAARALSLKLNQNGHQVSVVRFGTQKVRNPLVFLRRYPWLHFYYNLLRFDWKKAKEIKQYLQKSQLVKYQGPTDAPELFQLLKSLQPDLIVQKAGFILKENVINAPLLGVLNDHIACLPFFRGKSAMEWTILHGKPAGSTVHFIDAGVDTGAILQVFPENISRFKDNLSAKNFLFSLSDDKFIRVVEKLAAKEIKPQKQKEEEGKQFFEMHPLLLAYVNSRLKNGYLIKENSALNPGQPML